MKNLPAYKALLSASTASFAIVLTAFFPWANPARLAAQGCPLTCNDLTVVEVPASGSIELFPSMISDGDLSQVCPNGILNTQSQINNVWQPATGNMVFNTSHIGQIILSRIKDQVTGNSCWGNVQLVAAPPPPLDTIHFQLCARYWEQERPMKGITLKFQPNNPAFPYSPLLFNLDSTKACTEVTVVLSDYLPGTTFSYSASIPDTNYLNGLDLVDLCKITEHILGINLLPSPYSMIAADANKSGSITTFDLVEYKKLIEGIYQQLPNNTSWRFISDYCTFPNPSNPFQTGCIDGIDSGELAALNGDTAKVIGIKIGDVDGNARLVGEIPAPPTPTDSLTMLLPLGPLTPGVSVAVPIKFDKSFSLGSLHAQFFIDHNLVKYDSISDGLMDVNTATNAYFNPSTDYLRFLSSGYQNLFVPVGVPLFYIHLSPLVALNFTEAIRAENTPDLKNAATGNNCSIYYKIGATYSSSVSTYSPELHGWRVQPPSPNPFTDQTILELELESAETAILEVTDLMGRLVFSEQKELPTGTYRWEIPASAVATGGFSIWRVRVGGQMVSGKLARQ